MTPSPRIAQVPTPIGTFRVVYEDRELYSVDLLERGHREHGVPEGAVPERRAPPADSPPRQLRDYFAGKRSTFDVEFPETIGSEFDRAIWRELCKVPAGKTVTYGELARRSGHPRAARAVGGAMARNPFPIMVPCHRVVGDDRSLTGFGLGLWRKRWLLEHEGSWPLKGGTLYGPDDPSQRTIEESVPRAPTRAVPGLRPDGRPAE